MNIDELFKQKLHEGKAPVEDRLWQSIQSGMRPCVHGKGNSSGGSFSSISHIWHAMSGVAKVASVLGLSAMVTAGSLIVTKSLSDNEDGESKEAVIRDRQEGTKEQETIDFKDGQTIETRDVAQGLSTDKSGTDYEELNFETTDEFVATPSLGNVVAGSVKPAGFVQNPISDIDLHKVEQSAREGKSKCVDTIEGRKIEIRIPNLITPNNDGINDCFKIRNIDKYPDNVLIVKDRKGKTIWEKRHYEGDFCGENCPNGTYFYVLSIRFEGKISKYSGVLEIIR